MLSLGGRQAYGEEGARELQGRDSPSPGDKGLRGRRERGAHHLERGRWAPLRGISRARAWEPRPGSGLAVSRAPPVCGFLLHPEGLGHLVCLPSRALGAGRVVRTWVPAVGVDPNDPRAHGSEGHLAPASLGPRRSHLPAGT